MDFHPVLSRHAILKYITKYDSKAEKRSESYHDMLTRISNTSDSNDPSLIAYRRFLVETLVDRDIGALETCHMILMLPLFICSRQVFSLNVGKKILRKVSSNLIAFEVQESFIDVYKKRPSFLVSLCMIETTRSWSYDVK